ncbi:PE-PPE domain-containing protein [Mycobacterium heidelbergense]|uniref:Uncharacterized protein n=1 Tax=Mycobacterium heidelbergense TaxID=53376 RepID=A0A1X0DSC4_MYCHE|nr:PE-PPE domain-containing protein [Mycobacterium heidelbergense]MCV7051071.1 PE-PPE domain-containing protein [Mycobacterium heidelbergense]ORA75286.1 hypothetical protein BST25_04935 [Mycobacterium heidelbergense]BBZ50075.1 hypothetical protein MHEI_17920 [Mycobacterium heidelbergense]
MTGLTVQPQLLAAAAADASEIRSAIAAAQAAAAGPTTGMMAAAQDEVSTVTAAFFGAYGQEYQALLQQATAFQTAFVEALQSAEAAYTGAETAASNALGPLEANVFSLLGGTTAAVSATRVAAPITQAMSSAAATVTVVMGASGYPIPAPDYINQLTMLFVKPFYTVGTAMGLATPEGLYPLTGIKDLTLDISLARGLTILNNQIQSLVSSGTNTINVFGYSQSAIISSLEMQMLNPTNTPGGSLLPPGVGLNFSLIGDPANPNGGLLSRFPGLSLPSLGLTFGTATPDNSFPTKIFTIEYDGFADFPQYPINLLSDLNAFMGIVALHGTYPYYTLDQINSAIQLTNTVGNPLTQYFILPTQNLPLLDPLRAIPVIGNPVADLVQPDLKVLVDLGYGSTTQGWSPGAPNVPTPFGVIPPVSPGAVLAALAGGTQQGIGAFTGDINAGIAGIPSLSPPSLASIAGSIGTGGAYSLPAGLASALSSPDSFIASLQSANSRITDALTDAGSTAYATLLPTADIATALFTSAPSYDANLFLDGVQQVINGDPTGGLTYAFGAPVAADVALATLAGGFEFRVFEHAADTIVADLNSLA